MVINFSFIQWFMLTEVFIIGVLAAIAVQHAYAHFWGTKHKAEAVKPQLADPLSAVMKERLLKASQVHFEEVLNHSAQQLGQDLGTSIRQIDNLVKKLATEIVGDELENYRLQLAQLHKQAEIEITDIRARIASHEDEIKANLAKEMEGERQHLREQIAAEKQRLIKQIDTKLADAVGSFLSEALQYNIDLGSQSAYLVDLLETHKDDFKKEVGSEDQSPR